MSAERKRVSFDAAMMSMPLTAADERGGGDGGWKRWDGVDGQGVMLPSSWRCGDDGGSGLGIELERAQDETRREREFQSSILLRTLTSSPTVYEQSLCGKPLHTPYLQEFIARFSDPLISLATLHVTGRSCTLAVLAGRRLCGISTSCTVGCNINFTVGELRIR